MSGHFSVQHVVLTETQVDEFAFHKLPQRLYKKSS